MMRFYTPVLILQLFCLYHAYRSRTHFSWYLLILFLPLAGSLIYCYYHFVRHIDGEEVTEQVKGVFINDYHINKLEKELEFSDTLSNRLNLVDEYLKKGHYEAALKHYRDSLQGMNKDDVHTQTKMIKAYFLSKKYDEAIFLGNKLLSNQAFRKSPHRICYAWSLYHMNLIDKASEQFKEMDTSFSNHEQRLEHIKFLDQIGKIDSAKQKAVELKDEISQMSKTERRFKAETIRGINKMYAKLS